MDREQVIKTGISKNYKISKINKELQEIGEGEYNPLTYLPNYLNLPKQAWSNLVEGSKGLITAGSEFVKPIHEISKAGFKAQPGKKLDAVKEAFKKTILDNEQARRFIKGAGVGAGTGLALGSLLSPVGMGVGTVGGALTGGMVGLLGPKDFADTMLSTYHINLDDIKNKNIDYRDIAQGIFQNPLYAATDIAGPTRALKGASKVVKAITKDAGSLQQIVPGKQLADFNRELTNLKQWSRTQNADIYGGYNQLAKTPLANRKEIVKNIVSNTGDLTERDIALAEALKNDLRTSEREAIRLGLLDSTEARYNTVAQYVVDNLRDKSNILHHDIMKILNGQELSPRAINIIKEGNLSGDIKRLINEGNKLYREGNIAFLSQKLAGVQDPLGIEIARHINLDNPNRSDYARVIGRANPEQLGNVLDDTIKSQIDRLSKVRENIDVFKDILDSKNLGLKLSSKDKATALRAFRESLKQDEISGNLPDIAKAIDNSAIDRLLPNGKQNPFYKAIRGAMEYEGGNGVIDRISSNWKKNVLGNPSWVAGNRLGNWSLNDIEGVLGKDYADVAKYKELIPPVLKQQTSFNSYINKGSEALSRLSNKNLSSTIAESLNDFKRSWGRYKNSERTLANKAHLATDLLGNLSNIGANPWFSLESNLEYLDRAANFIRQAKREASATGKSLEEILKLANTDKEMFFKLNNEVNKSLGDYMGRNYAQPRDYKALSRAFVPFGKFFTQTLRTTAHGAANQPLSFATNITIPARAGQELMDRYLNDKRYNINPDWYNGGVPYIDDNGDTRIMKLTPSPIGIIGSRMESPKELYKMVSPLFGSLIGDIADYKKMDKTPTSPRKTIMERDVRKARKEKVDVNNYEPTTNERIGYTLNTLLANTFNPYSQITRYYPGLYGLKTGQGMQSLYDTMQPIKYKLDKNGYRVYEYEKKYNRIKSKEYQTIQNPISYLKTSPVELLGNMIGVSTQSSYKPRVSRSQMRRAMGKAKNIQTKTDKYRQRERSK